MPSLSPAIISIITPFAILFSRPVWDNVITLKIIVKSSGLKWLTMAASWRFPFSERYFALPFMTVLKPSALMGLYTIVCLIANRLQKEHPIEVAQTAWYEKKDATFSDLLKAVRKILWKDNLIFRKQLLESFRENNKGLDEIVGAGDDKISPEASWIGLLIEHLAAG